MRFLIGLRNRADANLGVDRIPCRNCPVPAFQVVRRLAPPDIDDVADRFREHLVAIDAANSERLRIGFERARADAEQEPPLQQVVQHRGLRGDQDRVRVRQIGRAGAELDLPPICWPETTLDASGVGFCVRGTFGHRDESFGECSPDS